jgi:hypothetical protein
VIIQDAVQGTLLNHNSSQLQKILHVHLVFHLHSPILTGVSQSPEEILPEASRDHQRPAIRIAPSVVLKYAPHKPCLGIFNIHAILAHDELALPVSVRQRGTPRQIIHLAWQLGAEVAGVRSEGLTTTCQHGRLPRTQTGPATTFLGADLAVGTVDFVPGFRAGCALACGIALEDHGAVENITT